MPDLRKFFFDQQDIGSKKENEDLKAKVSLLTRMKDRFKQQLTTLEGTIQQEKEKAWKRLNEERKNAFEKFCEKKGIDLQNKNKELQDVNTELTSSITELESSRNELEAMTLSLMTDNEEFERKVTSLSEEKCKLQEIKEQLSNKVRELEQNRLEREDILAGLLTERESLKTNIGQVEQTLSRERQGHAEEIQKANKRISGLEDLLRISTHHNERMTKEIDSLHGENFTLRETSLNTARELGQHKSSIDRKERDYVPLPADWEEMPEHKNCKVCPVTGSARVMVEQRFMQTIDGLNVKIIKVDRVQNRCLYKQYHLKKFQISEHSGSSKEKLLWHGTHGEAVSGITVNGFDRGFQGYNVGAIYGKGVYFSTSSKYSVDYSKNDVNREKHMFLARVLTGDSTQGKHEYRVLPIKDHSSYTRYDSLVDNETNPKIYVIMNDTQAYPEYLVTYQMTGT